MEIQYAKECVRQGLPVFPAAPDKSPLTAHGFRDASIDRHIILAWCHDYPDSLQAVPTGRLSGLLVIDIDPAGAEWYAEHAIDLACRRVHCTPRGHHLLYKMPEADIRCSAGTLAPGVDVRAIGGYVVWWPAHGHEATGDLDDIGPVPEWLMKKLKISKSSSISSVAGNGASKINVGGRNVHLTRAAGALRGQGLEVETIIVAIMAENTARCIPPLSAEEVEKIAQSITRYDRQVVNGTDEEPEPLRRPIPPAPDYPLDALGNILGPAAKRISEVVQSPSAICGQAVLAAASLAAQAHGDVFIDGRRELLSLWCISIAESGERKSAADDIALKPHRNHERLMGDEHRREMARHKDEAIVFDNARKSVFHQGKAKMRLVKSDLDPEDRKAAAKALATLGPAPPPPLKPWIIVSAPTLEGLHKLYRDGQPSIGLFHDDGGEFLGGHSMGRDHRMKSAAGMSKLWDRGEFDRIRGSDGMDKFFGRRLALHLMIQPVIAETILGDALLCGQGFLARCLLAWPSTRIGGRAYAATDLSADPALARYNAAITALLERDMPADPDMPQELKPRTLQLKPDAKQRWVALHDHIEESMASTGELYGVRAWGSKAPAQVLRIAGVLTLVDDPGASVIRVEAINQGAELVLHALAEAVRIIGTTQVPVEVQHAQALLEWCHRDGIAQLHSGAALQFGPYAIRNKTTFDDAVRMLEKSGWAVPVPGGADIDGKQRRRVWDIR